MEPTMKDRFEGCLLGVGVGDALGAPLEGLSRAKIARRFGRVTSYIDERFGAGKVTDDTQLTIALAGSIVEWGDFEPHRAAFGFGEWMRRHDEGVEIARGPGNATAAAARKIYQGTSPGQSGEFSAGCGSAVRAAPIGLLYHNDLAALKAAVVEQSKPTHVHPLALAGSAAAAFAVAYVLHQKEHFEAADFLDDTGFFVADLSKELGIRLRGIKAYLKQSYTDGFGYTGVGHFVLETVSAALFAFAKSPFDFEQVVVEAVNAGGDTDSVGAIAGAVAGAMNGKSGIPERWLAQLEVRQELENLAQGLWEIVRVTYDLEE